MPVILIRRRAVIIACETVKSYECNQHQPQYKDGIPGQVQLRPPTRERRMKDKNSTKHQQYGVTCITQHQYSEPQYCKDEFPVIVLFPLIIGVGLTRFRVIELGKICAYNLLCAIITAEYENNSLTNHILSDSVCYQQINNYETAAVPYSNIQ